MRDIVITPKRLKAELFVLLSVFVIAFSVNVFAVIKYGTPWVEIFSQIGYVSILTAILYAIHWVARILVWLVMLAVRAARK